MGLRLSGKLLAALVIALLALGLIQLQVLFEPEVSSAAGIDGTASRYLVGLILTLLAATASAVARLIRLRPLRDAHRWVEQCLKVGVLGGGAAGGSLAIVATLQRDLVDYAQQGSFATHQPAGVLVMGLIIALFALWALAYTVGEAVLKPPETDSGR